MKRSNKQQKQRKDRYKKSTSKFVGFEIPAMDKEQTISFAKKLAEFLSKQG